MKKNFTVLVVFLLIGSFLQSCGFRLRGASELPASIEFASVEGVAEFSEAGTAIKQQLVSSGAKVFFKPDELTIRFVVVRNDITKRVLSIDSAGRASEYRISLEFAIRVLDPKGVLLVAEYPVSLNRSYTYDVNNALAKSDEETRLQTEMISFAVRQAMRRIGIKLRDHPYFKVSDKDKNNKATNKTVSEQKPVDKHETNSQ